jgi:hypothetical protein
VLEITSYEILYVIPEAVLEVTVIDVPSSKYTAVVLSTTISDASAGTETVLTIGNAVPPAGADP